MRISMAVSMLFFFLLFFQEEKSLDYGFLDQIELKALDLKFLSRGPIPTHNQVAIAAIDEKAVERYGRWPWNRVIVAQLVSKLAELGASVQAYDIAFSDPDATQLPVLFKALGQSLEALELAPGEGALAERDKLLAVLNEQASESDPDRILAQAISQAPNVVLGFFIYNNTADVAAMDTARRKAELAGVEGSQIGVIKPWDAAEAEAYPFKLRKGLALRGPLPILAAATPYFGHVSFDQDHDGTIRWGNLLGEVDNPDDSQTRLIFPSLALKAAARHLDREVVIHTYPKGVSKVSLGLGNTAFDIPTNYLGRLMINYYGRQGHFPTYSVADILDGRVPPNAFKGRIVLIGATAVGLYDLRVAPFQENFPGVEIHATLIDNILNHNYLARPDWTFLLELSMTLFLGLLFGVALGRLPALWGVVFTLCALSSYYLLDRYFIFANGYWVRSVFPLTQATLIFVLCYIYRYMAEEREKQRTRAAFTHYLNASVIDQLMASYDTLKLGGEKRNLTVLFSDIRGFTTLSEQLSPDELGTLLTEYLNPMTQLVFEHDGVLDKYVGDEVMAFWGAPQAQPDHARRACLTALAMRDKLAELNVHWSARGLPNLAIGIGINSGPMWVGNMGSSVRFDYTVIGDAVNLGARLEGTNKVYGTNLIISEFTKAEVGESFLCRKLDLIAAKGKTQPVAIYELLAAAPGTEQDRAKCASYEAAYALYAEGRFTKARLAFAAHLVVYPDDAPARVFEVRCRRFEESPPPALWNGVNILTEK